MILSHLTRTLAPLVLAGAVSAQGIMASAMETPKASPRAQVSQIIGITDVSLDFHRPAVKQRVIWGGLVPYNQVWRCGANENTVITFSHPVSVEGQALPAGSYGLHAIPTPEDWTIVFSNNAASWGSYSYDPSEDALRVTVTPRPAPHREWMAFEFEDLAPDGATLVLAWEQLAVPVRIDVDTHAVVLDMARNDYLRGLAQWTWQGWNQAASYCLQNKVNLEEGLAWASRSVQITPGFTNLWTKGQLEQATGRDAQARETLDLATQLATQAERNWMGYQLMGQGRLEEAIEVFEANVAQYPAAWNCHDSLAEAYGKNGEVAAAIEQYRKALELVADDLNRARIASALKQLGG